MWVRALSDCNTHAAAAQLGDFWNCAHLLSSGDNKNPFLLHSGRGEQRGGGPRLRRRRLRTVTGTDLGSKRAARGGLGWSSRAYQAALANCWAPARLSLPQNHGPRGQPERGGPAEVALLILWRGLVQKSRRSNHRTTEHPFSNILGTVLCSAAAARGRHRGGATWSNVETDLVRSIGQM